MAKTIKSYTSDGVQTVYPINFTLGYLNDKSLVYVYTGDDYTTQVPYTWVDDNNIDISPVLPNGTAFKIRRVVDRTNIVNDYSNAAILREKELDQSFLQVLMIMEEVEDGYMIPVPPWIVNGDIDMNQNELLNLAAVQAEDIKNVAGDSLLTLAQAHKDAAATSETNAAASASAASSSASSAASNAATVAADKAIVAADKAAVAADLVATNQDTIDTAADAVATAADKVATNADAATVAADKAIVAADKATVNTDKGIVAADKAIVAADKATVNTDKGIVAADKAIVAADKATVNTDKGIVAADKATVAADKAIVAADKATVAADKATVAADKAAVAADLVATNQDTIDTAADAAATAADKIATNADAATCTTKASEASTSASNAAISETNAAASASAAAASAASVDVHLNQTNTFTEPQIIKKAAAASGLHINADSGQDTFVTFQEANVVRGKIIYDESADELIFIKYDTDGTTVKAQFTLKNTGDINVATGKLKEGGNQVLHAGNVTNGTAAPSGGNDEDIYIKYTA